MLSGKLNICLVIVLGLFGFSLSGFSQDKQPEPGVFDGTVGTDRLVLVAENSESELVKGYFVLNRGKAVEEVHPFSLRLAGAKPFFQSDLFVGPIKSAFVSTDKVSGKLTLMNRKKRFLFWRPKAEINLLLRPQPEVSPTERYQSEIFSNIEVKRDLLYGKAKGYWTRSPYSDDPYITTLSKGLIKSFKDPELLDLKMDIYYPKTDLFKNRPCVMLIHGGAFYIGSKESACEETLATTLAKRGYVVASIDYRLGFKLTPTEIEMSAYRAIQDAHAALRFLAHNAKGLGIDPTQIYIGGTSAGGVASLNVTFMDNDERPQRISDAAEDGRIGLIEESGNKYPEQFAIKSIANMWGAVSDLNIIDADEKVSVLSIHGTNDDVVPFEYDYPFRNSLMVNRLIVDKMYGSKPIHDRLNSLGFRNKLISLPGLGHEPELETYNKLNHYMDTINYQVSKFFYEETAPSVLLPASQLSVSAGAALKSMFYEVTNGEAVEVTAAGGVKANSSPTDATIIWFSNVDNRKLKILSTNKYEAWNLKEFPVTVLK